MEQKYMEEYIIPVIGSGVTIERRCRDSIIMNNSVVVKNTIVNKSANCRGSCYR